MTTAPAVLPHPERATTVGVVKSRLLGNEKLWLVALVALSTAARTAAAMFRPSSLFFPDEYVYAELARSIAAGGVPEVRGQFIHFPGLLGPYLMAPGWLIGNVDVAVRALLGWASLWFSLAAVPAYALARRVDVSPLGALVVALLAVSIPDGAFTSTLLTEPFAYPVFLVTILACVEALAHPTPRRQALTLVLMLVLCLLRFEFAVVPVAYLLAAVGCSGFSLRTAARRQWVLVASFALVVLAALVVGLHRVIGYYTERSDFHYSPLAVARWFGIDLFVLLVAAGWVVVPGAVVGLRSFLRAEPRQRAFAVLSPLLIAALLLITATFGVRKALVYERYMFYVVPLVAIAFIWSLESLPRDRLYVLLAYGLGGAALLLPLVVDLNAASSDMSPTLLGLDELGTGKATLVWAAGLSILAFATGLRLGGRLATPLTAVVVLLTVGSAGSVSFLSFASDLVTRLNLPTVTPRLRAPRGTALVISPATHRALLPRTLFWNPRVNRVLFIGTGTAPDGFATTDVALDPGKGFVDAAGRLVNGPYAFDSDTVALSMPRSGGRPSERAVTATAPIGIVFGLNQVDHFLETVSWADFVSGKQPLVITIRFVSRHGTKTMSVACDGDARTVVVGRLPTAARIPVPPESRRECRISLVKGMPVSYGNRTVSVQARLTAQEAAGAMPVRPAS